MTLEITLLHGQGPFYLLVTNTLKYYKVLNFILVSCTDSHGLVVMRVAIGTEGSRFKPLDRQHFFPIFFDEVHNFLIKVRFIHLYLKFGFSNFKFISNLKKKSNFMIFSKIWKEKSCPETGFEPQTFEIHRPLPYPLLHGANEEARKKSFEVKNISLFVTSR